MNGAQRIGAATTSSPAFGGRFLRGARALGTPHAAWSPRYPQQSSVFRHFEVRVLKFRRKSSAHFSVADWGVLRNAP